MTSHLQGITAPRMQRSLSDRVQSKLLRMARANSESFARSLMATARAVDGGGDAPAGIEFVDSLNGIDVFEDVTHAHANASTRLRSFCHIDADIEDTVRRLTTTSVTVNANAPRLLPGIVETKQLCSVLSPSAGGEAASPTDKELPEQAGVNWFVLDRGSVRDSMTTSIHRTSSCSGAGGGDGRGGWRGRGRTSSSMEERGPDSGAEGNDLAFDFVVLSYQGVFKHRGRRGWVQWCQSIELSSFPPSLAEHVQRGVVFSSGIVAVESATRPGQVSMCYAMGVDLSACDSRERRLLESAVWKRVMKLAALKKAMLRESVATTLSIASADFAEQELDQMGRSNHFQRPSETRQPECEPATKTLAVAAAVGSRSTKSTPATDKRRQRAHTMEPAASPSPRPHNRSLFREPSSLEFRLTFYDDPDADVHEVRESIAVLEDAKAPKESRSSRLASVFKTSKPGRPMSRSLGQGLAGWR